MIDFTDAIECAPGTRTAEVAQIEETEEAQLPSVFLPDGPTIRVVAVELKPYRKGVRRIFYGEHQGKKFIAYS